MTHHHIQHSDDGQQGMFFIQGEDGERLAKLTYYYADGHSEEGHKILVANHTGTQPVLRGQGIAGKLFHELVTWARHEGHKIDPHCSYIRKKLLDDLDTYGDLVLGKALQGERA